MSEIRTYLEAKLELGPKEWLRREPRETHPEILEAVRAFRAAGGFYNDDAERHVEAIAGDLPEHRHHGHPDRDPLTYQLGHEVYLAVGLLDDERARDARAAALQDGYRPLADADVREGARYLLRTGTVYGGRGEAEYAAPVEVRAVRYGERWAFLPPRKRTRGIVPTGPALVKAVTS